QRLAPGEGLLSILALAVSTSTVRAWHRERGLGTEQSWHVLADLGQQMRVRRRRSGRLGLHQLPSRALNWRARLVHLGRLQSDVPLGRRGTARERWVLRTHSPASGSRAPAALEDSCARAAEYFPPHYADPAADRPEGAPRFGHEFVCDSWLMNDLLPRELGD